MKRNFITLLSLLIVFSVFSQKTVKTSLGSFSFSGYPTLKMPTSYKLYALVDETGMSHPYGKPVSNCIVLANRTKVRNAESAEITIHVTNVHEMSSHIVIEPNPHFKDTETPTVKAKQFKEISFDVMIEDTAGTLYIDAYRKRQDAETKWMDNGMKAEKAVTQQLQSFNLINELRRYNTLINTKLGAYNLTAIYLHVFGAKNKSKGSYDYDSLNFASKQYKEAVKAIKADEFDTLRFTEKADSCVRIWEHELDNYRIGDQRITEEIAAGLHYNLASYYIFIKDYENALDELELSEKTHKGFSNAKEIYTIVRTWRNMKRNYEKLMTGESE